MAEPHRRGSHPPAGPARFPISRRPHPSRYDAICPRLFAVPVRAGLGGTARDRRAADQKGVHMRRGDASRSRARLAVPLAVALVTGLLIATAQSASTAPRSLGKVDARVV